MSAVVRVCWCYSGLQIENAAKHHVIQASRAPLAVALTQVRGAERRFGGNKTDPFNYKRRKNRLKQQQRNTKVPLVSTDMKAKKIDLPFRVTSLSRFGMEDWVKG